MTKPSWESVMAAKDAADFKVGDRVQIHWESWTGPGVVVGVRRPWVQVKRDSDGGLGGFRANQLSLLPVEPYEPRDGDEITISLRGKVSGPAAGGWDLTSDGVNFWQQDFDDYEVTVHDRGPEPKPKLPTTPGSVIQSASNRRVLVDGQWLLVDGPSTERWLDQADKMLHQNYYEVLFDAGAK